MGGNGGPSGRINRVDNEKDFLKVGEPNSRTDYYKNGKLNKQRWYGPDGRAVHDRHFNDHGNSKLHPVVPHDHNWDWSIGEPGGWLYPDENFN